MPVQDMTIRLTAQGFTAKWQDSDGQWWMQEMDLRGEGLHPFMWQTNAAQGEVQP